jgi:integrase
MAQTRGGRGNVLKRKNADGSLRFEAYGRRAGSKKKFLGSFQNERQARHALDDDAVLQRQIARGELPPEVDRRRTFEAVAKEWLTSAKRKRSVSKYEGELDRNVYPTLRSVPITSVTTPMMEDLQRVLTERPGLSPRSVAHTMAVVASIVRHAWVRGYIPNNPAVAFTAVAFAERSFQWIRTKAEIERLLSCVGDPHRTMFALLVMTGLRRNEALYLEWVDVDLPQRLICVQRGPHGMPKGKRLRYVPIGDALLPVLKRWRLLSGDVAGLVFPAKGGRVLSENAVTCMFKRSALRAGIAPEIRLHDLRHTYASHFMRDGGDIFRLSKYLGHATVLITERIYAHLAPDDYSKDWGRVAVRVQFEDAEVTDITGERRESDHARLQIVDGGTGES